MMKRTALRAFLAAYGYPALFLGCFLEGETTLVTAGFLSRQGYLNWGLALGTAFVATLLADQAAFHLGRHGGGAFLRRHPRLRRRVALASRKVARHHNWLAFAFQFFMGLRVAMAFSMGLSRISWRRFLLLNSAGILAWSVLWLGGGWAFGVLMETLLGRVRHHEALALALLGGVCLALWALWSGLQALRRRRRGGDEA